MRTKEEHLAELEALRKAAQELRDNVAATRSNVPTGSNTHHLLRGVEAEVNSVITDLKFAFFFT